jgi:ATP-dependent helicase STH1/SNF2
LNATGLKNHESKFAVTLSTRYTTRHRLILTGTPLQNNLRELWALLNFLLPNIFKSSSSFEEWFSKPFVASGITSVSTAAGADGENDEIGLQEEEKLLIIQRLHQVLQPFVLRRMKTEVASQLPQKTESVIKVELSAWQITLYDRIQKKIMNEVDADGNIKPARLNNTVMQLRKGKCNLATFDETYHIVKRG